MKRIVYLFLFVMLCAGFAWAVPSFTPTIDGVKDAGWGAVPDEATSTVMQPAEFNYGDGMYVTDDGQYVYFGFMAPADPWPDGASVHAHIEIDVGGTSAGGYYDQWGSQVTYAFPFQPEYDVITQWNTDNQAIGWTGFQAWNGSGWTQTQLPSIQLGGGGGMWTEVALNRALIGNPAQGSQLHLSMWARPGWNKNNASVCLPAEATFPSDYGDGSGQAFHNQFAYTIQTAMSDTSHPHILSVRQIDPRAIEIMFSEPMNQTTVGNVGNYTPTGWICTGTRYITATTVGLSAASTFAAGSPYSVTLNSNIQDVAGNGMDPAFATANWNGTGYANVTFTVIDLSALQDSIFLKGSWNFYHEYDASWSWGHLMMYDDGTHNDPVANDHQFTLVLPLVPNGGSPEFNWGYEDEHNNWLVVGGNQVFALSTTDPLAVSHTIPDATQNAIDVTVNVDMQFVTEPFTGVKLMGVLGNWGDGYDMSDPDLDGMWSVTVTIPAGSQRDQEFKFKRVNGVDLYWESVGNRTFHLVDGPTQITVSPNYYENYLPVPSVTCYPTATEGVILHWNNWPRVHFQIFDGSSPDDIVNLVTTVQGSSYTVAGPLDTKRFYQVKTAE
jgi:hypothetical protein